MTSNIKENPKKSQISVHTQTVKQGFLKILTLAALVVLTFDLGVWTNSQFLLWCFLSYGRLILHFLFRITEDRKTLLALKALEKLSLFYVKVKQSAEVKEPATCES